MIGMRGTLWRWLFVAWVALSLGLVQALVLRGDPVTTDENSYLFQAHVFANARLWAPLPAEGRLLDFDFSMINFTDDRWFSRYFFGHPLALVPGVLVGYPLLTPFLMGLASVLLIRALGRHCYSDCTGSASMLLLGLSPFFLVMHGTLLSHTSCMLALLVFMLGCVKVVDSQHCGWGLLAGACLGFAVNTRPWTSVLMAWPFLAWLVWSWVRCRSRVLLHQLVAMGLAGVVFLGGYFLYNWLLTGDWWLTPYNLYNSTERLGFVYVRMVEMQHTPAAGLENTFYNLRNLNYWWLGAPVSFGLLVLLPFQRLKIIDGLLLLSAVSLVGGYFFFYFPGISTVGPVYYFELLIPLSLLGARAAMVVWETGPWWSAASSGRRMRFGLCIVLVWIGLLGHFWWNWVPTLERRLAPQRRAEAAVTDHIADDAIVFFGDRESEWMNQRQAVRYDPFAPRNVIYLRIDENRYQQIMGLYPTRPAYLYEGGELKRLR